MIYKEQITEHFKRYKQSEKTARMYEVIVDDISRKYKDYINQGFTRRETEDKITTILSNLRGHYPVLNSLPLCSVSGGDVTRTSKIMFFLLYLVVSAALYTFIPVLAFVPQLVMGLLLFHWSNEVQDKYVVKARLQYVLLLALLLVIQMIGMWIRYPSNEDSLLGIASVYFVVFFFYVILCLLFLNQKRESPKQSFLSVLITGPLLTRNVNLRIYFVFVFYSIIAYGGHLVMYFLENLFRAW